MVRRLLAILTTALAPHAALAQHVGVTLDRVSSTVDWQYPKPPADCFPCVVDASPNASRGAIGGGVVVALRSSRRIGIGSEILLAPRGYAVTQPTLEVNYLSLPQLVRLGKLNDRRVPFTLFVEAGIAPAIRLNCRVRYSGISDPCYNGAAFGQDWRIRRFDASAVAGAGVSVRLSQQVLLIRGRIDYGLLDIGGPEAYPTKHRSFALSAAWLAPLRRVQ
jgi:hypothetical protein